MNIKLQITAICVAFLSTVSAATLAKSELMINGVSFESRAHWMRLANSALEISGSPCPLAAFGTVIVNHTGSDTGKLICMGVNENSKTGNPSLHGQNSPTPFLGQANSWHQVKARLLQSKIAQQSWLIQWDIFNWRRPKHKPRSTTCRCIQMQRVVRWWVIQLQCD